MHNQFPRLTNWRYNSFPEVHDTISWSPDFIWKLAIGELDLLDSEYHPSQYVSHVEGDATEHMMFAIVLALVQRYRKASMIRQLREMFHRAKSEQARYYIKQKLRLVRNRRVSAPLRWQLDNAQRAGNQQPHQFVNSAYLRNECSALSAALR